MSNFNKIILYGLVVFATISLPLSLMRIPDTGFLPVYLVHIILTITIYLAFAFKQKLPESFPSKLAIIIFTLIFLAGLYNYGIVSQFLVFLNLSALIITVVYGLKNGIIYVVISVLISLTFAYLYSAEILLYPIDLNLYSKTMSVWVILLIASVIANVFTFSAIHYYQEKINKKNSELSSALDKLKLALDHVEELKEKEKNNIYKATVSSSQHILGNLLNQLSLVKMEIDKNQTFNPDVAQKFDAMKLQAKDLLTQLSSVTEVEEQIIRDSVKPK